MLVKCEKCKHSFNTDLRGDVFCPKCGAKNINKSVSRSDYHEAARRLNEILDGFAYVLSVQLYRQTKNSFDCSVQCSEFHSVTEYADITSKYSINFVSRKVHSSHLRESKGRSRSGEVRINTNSPGSGLSVEGVDSVSIDSYDVLTSSDDEIVNMIRRKFDEAHYMGKRDEITKEAFEIIWDTLSGKVFEAVDTAMQLREKGGC